MKITRAQLDEMAMDVDISSQEGLDANHMSRARIQFLTAQNQALVNQFQFADAKAGVLITLMGLLAFQRPEILPVEEGVVAMAAFSFLVVTLIVTCLILALLAVLPRFPDAAARKAQADDERFSWPGLTSLQDGNDYTAYMRTAQASQLIISIARSNQNMAQILLRKYFLLRVSFLIALLIAALISLSMLAEAGLRLIA